MCRGADQAVDRCLPPHSPRARVKGEHHRPESGRHRGAGPFGGVRADRDERSDARPSRLVSGRLGQPENGPGLKISADPAGAESPSLSVQPSAEISLVARRRHRDPQLAVQVVGNDVVGFAVIQVVPCDDRTVPRHPQHLQ